MSVAVYRAYDADGVLLYVGCSRRWPLRFEQHAGARPWWDEVTRVDLQHFATCLEAFAAERNAIASEYPLYNIAGKSRPPVRRARRPRGPLPLTPLKRVIFSEGFKQSWLAEQIGVDQPAMSRIVNGLHCNDATRAAIAQALQRNVEDLWPDEQAAAA